MFAKQTTTMHVFLAISLLLIINNAQSAMVATVDVHADASNVHVGELVISQIDADSPVTIRGQILKLTPNTVHGFHVHANPLLNGELNCTAAGPHFNPYNTSHGSITADIMHRHVGDLGNVTSDNDGTINVRIEDSIIQLFNATQSIANRTIVLHAMRDDGGTGGFPDSKTTGDAGARIACGNINLLTNHSIKKPNVFATLFTAIKRFFH